MKEVNSEGQTIVYARGKYDGFMLLLLTLSLAGNVALGFGVVKPAGGTSANPAAAASPAVGTKLPPLQVQRLDGATETIRYVAGEPPTVVYVFTPSCKWCTRNLDNLRAISAAARQKGFRLIGVSLDPAVEEYRTREGLDFPVYIAPQPETVRAFGLGVTPQTFVISPTGALEKEWKGAYTGQVKTEVESWLGMRLPGLSAASAPSSSID